MVVDDWANRYDGGYSIYRFGGVFRLRVLVIGLFTVWSDLSFAELSLGANKNRE